ncbi:MAG TPA: DUF3618 domain-containing protein [Streptosporangiaceae bacterium]|nr:DUF3618 domain-containing protein [Streptosporangiaceae bacterium]
MADPDSRAPQRAAGTANGKGSANGVVTGTVTTNGRVARRDSDDLVAEIERTRQNLARTIDTLAERVSPASNVRRFRERATEELRKPEVQLAAAAVVFAVTGITIYRIWGRRPRG